MGLEAATMIHQLNAAWPLGGTDLKSAGDDHLRVIKAAIQGTFANVAGAVTATHTELNLLAGKTGTVWTSTNDGAGSGLDADLLDGLSSAAFAAASHPHSAADITSGTLAVARGGTGQTTQLGITREVTKAWTIQADPGGTPAGTAGDVFAYY